jgi:4-amino-4-deoxy-L-arabinose transferase-like glycosyltransferase
MADRVARQGRLVLVLLALGFLANILVRLSLPHTLELDEAEQIFFSQWLQWGYGPQPPLYNWLQTGLFALTGPSVFGLSLLKNLLIFGCFLFYWLAAGLTLKDDRLRVAAVLGLLTLPQVSFMAQQDLTHTVLLLAAAALFLYAFFRILAKPDILGYLLAGLAVAVGFLAKYNFPLLPIAALLAVLPEKDLRDRIFTWRLLLTIAIAFVLVLPHSLWLLDHLDQATDATLGKMTGDGEFSFIGAAIKGFGSLLVAIVAFSALTLVLFVAIFRRATARVLAAQSQQIRIVERMLVLLFVALLVIILATGATHIRERWLDPFLLVLPLYLCMKVEAAGQAQRLAHKALLVIPLIILIAVPASLYLRVATSSVTGKYTKLNVPYDVFIGKVLAEEGVTPSVVVAEDRHLAGNIRLQLDTIPVMATQFPDHVLPFSWAADRPVLLAWRSGPLMPETMKNWVDINAGPAKPFEIRTATLPYHYGKPDDTYAFRYAWIYPADR